ncbi:MAG: hypothetical protein A2W25_14690 [candidate division Zixibacteria bacterium RBG_16_53_22]|nr:MAG: hypothetical protein A2W25_14690 [candidate division Zixibacteria bacterium RBG_16_53_22]
MKQNQVVEKQNTALALSGQFEEDVGGGFETADSSAYAIPFLAILQSGSPQVKKSDGAYIKGAEEGMLYNTVTQQVHDGAIGVVVVPFAFKRSFIKWAPRDSGGGFKGELQPSDPQVQAGVMDTAGRLIDGDGNLLSDTRTHYVMVLDDNGGYHPAVISLASTQIKKSRQWMSKMNGIKMQRSDGTYYTPAMFSHRYKITAVPESNDKGSWFGVKVETLGAVESGELYQAAKAFRDAVRRGEAKEQAPQAAAGATFNPDADDAY